VKAAVGDRITVHGLHVGDATRCGEVLEVKGVGGEPPYVVRWDDGHEAVFVPGSGVRVDPPARRPPQNPAEPRRTMALSPRASGR
jgi:hypothetical protein